MTHELRCWPEPFEAIVSGRKRHEVRQFDRPFREGDEVQLHEWDPERADYTRRTARFTIGSVSTPGTWGLPPGLCVFTLIDRDPRVLPEGTVEAWLTQFGDAPSTGPSPGGYWGEVHSHPDYWERTMQRNPNYRPPRRVLIPPRDIK